MNYLFFMGRLQKQMVQFQSVFIHLQVGDKVTSNQVSATGSFLTKAYIAKYGTSAHGGIAFKVLHRQSRIFSGTNVITTVKPGGKIITDGYSSSGSSYPYRLSIKGYIHAGSTKYHKVTNGWCDTDLEIGKSMYNTVTIDGKWV
nr:hypothetical protein [Bacillus velezensis]